MFECTKINGATGHVGVKVDVDAYWVGIRERQVNTGLKVYRTLDSILIFGHNALEMSDNNNELSNLRFTDILARVNNIIQNGSAHNLKAEQISKEPLTFKFSLEKPLLDIDLPAQYRTAMIVTIEAKEENSVISTTYQTPPFVPISIFVVGFLFLFDWFILKTSDKQSLKSLLVFFVVSIVGYYLINKDKLRVAFEKEILEGS